MQELSDKRVLVVGASSGIGQGIAVSLVQKGAHVAAAGRRLEALELLRAELGPSCAALSCDVRSPADCETVVQRAVEALGGLDAVVYAAGVSRLTPLMNADASLWQEILETNLVGASLVCRAAVPHLRASAGRAVFLGSSSSGRPFPGLCPYAASKAALDELVRGWRAENPDLCFTTVVVGPTTGTEFASGWDGDLAAQMFPFWERHGYLSGGASMSAADVSEVVCAALIVPCSISTVAVQACDPAVEPAVR